MPYTITRNAVGGNPALIAKRSYEATRDAMRSVENNAGGTQVSRYTYAVNPITQRESVTTAGLAFGGTQANWRWDYDALGQVVRADNTTTNASDRTYAYDNIGNRLTSGAGVSLASLSSYTPNALNQYTQSTTSSQPTVNPSFDADGNMSAGPVPGSAGNTPGIQAPANATEMKWDAENRLVFMKIGAQPVYFDYDYLSRLIARGITMPIRRHYCYDGWNRISEYIAGSVFNTFTWGTDLSGSMQGAGGVGGLLAMRWVDSSGNADYFPTYDGNGNVSEYLRTTGGIASHYEYDPFGRLTRLTGQTNTRFQYRFSTKPRDFDSGLYYYGYRWYDPLTGRWPSRDPIEERGGVNLYGFVGNDGVNGVDILGAVEALADIMDVNKITPIWISDGAFENEPTAFGFNNTQDYVKCICCENKKISCKIVIRHQIYLNGNQDKVPPDIYKNDLGWEGVYGHEQQHIVSKNAKITESLVNIRNIEDDPVTAKHAEEVTEEVKEIIHQALLLGGGHDEDKKPKNPAPIESKQYPRKKGSPEIPAKKKDGLIVPPLRPTLEELTPTCK